MAVIGGFRSDMSITRKSERFCGCFRFRKSRINENKRRLAGDFKYDSINALLVATVLALSYASLRITVRRS